MSTDQGVAAVDRALSILDVFNEHEPRLSLAEIAKRTGLYKSTVLRLARSLEKYGYLLRGQEGSYQLASKVFYLGSLYQRHFESADVVPPVLQDIVGELREGASFYVRDGDQRVCLHRVEAQRSVRHSVHEGDRLPLQLGAAGHVIRAFEGAAGERYERIRRDMYCTSFGERDPEVSAVACPVFGIHQKFIGALAVSGPRYRIDAAGTDRIVQVLFKHARQLSSTFGAEAQVFPATRGRKKRVSKDASRARPAASRRAGQHER